MICAFCISSIFSEDIAETGIAQKPHHASPLSWARSLLEPGKCTICWTFWHDVIEKLPEASKPMAEAFSDEDSLAEAIAGAIKCWPKFATGISQRGKSFGIDTTMYEHDSGKRTPTLQVLDRFVLQPVSQDEEGILRSGDVAPRPEHDSGAIDLAVGDPFRLPLQWIRECNESHVDCRTFVKRQREREEDPSSHPFVPTRLIYVGTTDKPLVRLVDDAEATNLRGAYIALSHCWGDPTQFRPPQLLKSNILVLRQNIQWEELPLTFQQAIAVCRSLGVRYIWIDSLCVLQDDVEDWRKEAAKIPMVYRNTYCNIAAVNASDGRGGLMQYQRPRWLPPEAVAFQGGMYRLSTSNFWDAHVVRQPLSRRAWVMQERVLSPRTLYFTSEQIFWHCPSLEACEGAPGGLPVDLGRRDGIALLPMVVTDIRNLGLEFKRSSDEHIEMAWRRALHKGWLDNKLNSTSLTSLRLWDIWRSIVRIYTSCELTRATDKLLAVSGVASIARQALGLERQYAVGMWFSQDSRIPWFIDQLGWQVQHPKEGGRRPSRRYDKYCAPSWSWASMDGVIDIVPGHARTSEHRFHSAIMLGNDINLLDDRDHTGPVKPDCTLHIQGRMLRLPKHPPRVVSTMTVSTKERGSSTFHWRANFDDNRDSIHYSGRSISKLRDADRDENLLVLLLGFSLTHEAFARISAGTERDFRERVRLSSSRRRANRCIVKMEDLLGESREGGEAMSTSGHPSPRQQNPQDNESAVPKESSNPTAQENKLGSKPDHSDVDGGMLSVSQRIQAPRGSTPGEITLEGRAIILKHVEGRAGYFSRIGCVEFCEFREGLLCQVEDLFIREAEDVGSEAYDAALGHLITLI